MTEQDAKTQDKQPKEKQEAPPKELIKWAQMTEAEKEKLSARQITTIAQKCELPLDGTRVTLMARLDLLAARRCSDATVTVSRYRGRRTRCPICGYKCYVNGSERQEMGADKALIKRSMKCTGPGNHTFLLKDIVRSVEKQT